MEEEFEEVARGWFGSWCRNIYLNYKIMEDEFLIPDYDVIGINRKLVRRF